jgi:hypothetical protein
MICRTRLSEDFDGLALDTGLGFSVNLSTAVDLPNAFTLPKSHQTKFFCGAPHIWKDMSRGLLSVDIGPHFAYKITNALEGVWRIGENHGTQETSQEAEEGQGPAPH